MFCSKCGNILSDHAKYCTSCGAKVERHSTAVNAVAQFEGHQKMGAMGFTDAILHFFRNYFQFSGRARRSEFWWPMLLIWVVMTVLVNHFPEYYDIVGALLFFPWLSLCVRRLHDVGKRGSYLLWLLLPIIGGLLVMIQCLNDSQPGENAFGDNPKFCC